MNSRIEAVTAIGGGGGVGGGSTEVPVDPGGGGGLRHTTTNVRVGNGRSAVQSHVTYAAIPLSQITESAILALQDSIRAYMKP